MFANAGVTDIEITIVATAANIRKVIIRFFEVLLVIKDTYIIVIIKKSSIQMMIYSNYQFYLYGSIQMMIYLIRYNSSIMVVFPN